MLGAEHFKSKPTATVKAATQRMAAPNWGCSLYFIDSNKILLLAERKETHSAEGMRIIGADSLNVQGDKSCKDAFCSEGSDKLWQHKVSALTVKTEN